MYQIIIGTTPTILFTYDEVDPTKFVAAEMTIKGRDGIRLTKTLSEASVSGSQIFWKLSQQETLSFGVATLYVMCNWLLADGTRGASKETALQFISNHDQSVLSPNGETPSTDIIVPVAPSGSSSGVVTPQMYGAKGNGSADDSDAIQNAINAGKPVYFPDGTYLISKPIVVTNKHFWNLYAQDAVFDYTGDDFAFRIENATHCRIDIGYIRANNGGGVGFFGTSDASWNQYIELKFSCISAKTDCVYAETSGEGWCNENYVYGGRFLAGVNGVHLKRYDGVHGLNGWKFYNCGIEGVSNGFLFDAGGGDICNNIIVNPRYGESFETILKTVGTVYDCKWIAPSPILPSFIVASSDTTCFIIDAPIGTYWHMHDTAFIRGAIMDGKLMGERPSLVEVPT